MSDTRRGAGSRRRGWRGRRRRILAHGADMNDHLAGRMQCNELVGRVVTVIITEKGLERATVAGKGDVHHAAVAEIEIGAV